ncbi:hypothetical protein BU23DRAFT_650775 [Bimuria novae-zelandiae CBS 107.79]|uniref:Uncharacterized protein n=1 Tax=Bimuria novae-zelandiae CBS 107.79 TaxID=1447943 RepID=A0A6A5UZE3_9PLEO|nr:hypothetical protein BU23DRAFT_650775 [Bimuria novae-zelandiae CBS 107.79]
MAPLTRLQAKRRRRAEAHADTYAPTYATGTHYSLPPKTTAEARAQRVREKKPHQPTRGRWTFLDRVHPTDYVQFWSRPVYSDKADDNHPYFSLLGCNAEASTDNRSTAAKDSDADSPNMSRAPGYAYRHRDPIIMKKTILCGSDCVVHTLEDALSDLLDWIEEDVHERLSCKRLWSHRSSSREADTSKSTGQNGMKAHKEAADKPTPSAAGSRSNNLQDAHIAKMHEQAAKDATETTTRQEKENPIPPSSTVTLAADDNMDGEPLNQNGKRGASSPSSAREEKRVRFEDEATTTTPLDKGKGRAPEFSHLPPNQTMQLA